MIKNNLPVILLKGLVLLPHEDARVELNNDVSKKVIDISKLYHNNEVLIVTPINDLEESPDTGDLPKVGVVAKVASRIVLPNGNTRVVLSGLKRVKVLSYVNYSNEEDVLESIIVNVKETESDEVLETALLRKLINELDKYIGMNPYISNSILSQIKGITDLDKLTDKIANFIPLTLEKKMSFMLDMNCFSRAKKLITEINIELAVLELESKIEQNLRSSLDESQKELILKEKMKAIKKELGEKDSKSEYVSKIREKLKNIYFPSNIANRIIIEINRYESTPEISPELGVIRNYIDYILSIPWGVKSRDEAVLSKIKDSLDKSHYGLLDVKDRILEYIAVSSYKNNVQAPIICLVGPPGVGKTTLASSIASALNKGFSKISLGGVNDPSELIGHRKTYLGSEPGKIISALIKSKTMNPVILLDEIDKISSDYKGDPANALLDLLDSNQNKAFLDNYIEEEIDLSLVTWIVTANDLSKIPYVLLDRLEIIEISSYIKPEKVQIAKNYLIPNNLKKVGLSNNAISFTESAIERIIDFYTRESGVRELDRLISKVMRKVITDSKLANRDVSKMTIGDENIVKYLDSQKYNNRVRKRVSGYVMGLAYTLFGGELLELEVTSYDGEEKFITTGSLGKVLNESIAVALSYIKSNKNKFKIKDEQFNKTLHLNFREISIPKDGPSAGVLITTGILSHLLDIPVSSNVSMTGEITLLGEILPVGGIREKASVALRENIDILYVSVYNKREIELLDDYLKEKIEFRYVTNFVQIYEDLFERSEEYENRKNRNKKSQNFKGSFRGNTRE